MTVAEKAVDKREEILQKGLEVIWTKGYNDTSVNDIVKSVGIPKGSFYYYFESKEAFAIEALNTYIEYIKGLMHNAMGQVQGETPLDKIKMLIERKVDFMVEDPYYKNGCYMFNLSSEMAMHSEQIGNAIAGHCCDIYGMLEGLVQEAIDAGQITNTSAKEVVAFMDYAWNGAAGIYKSTKDPATFDNLKNILFNKILT